MNNFLDGIARVLDIGGVYPVPEFVLLSDEEAIGKDWEAIGTDLKNQLPPGTYMIYSKGCFTNVRR